MLQADTGALTATLDLQRGPIAIAIDDRHETVWALTHERRLTAYDYLGKPKVSRPPVRYTLPFQFQPFF